MTNAAQEGAERGAAAPGTPDEGDQSMFDVFGKKYGIPGSKVVGILSATSFRLDKDGKAPTVEQIVALIAVCNAYDLNPFTKEIYAFPDSKKNSVIPVVSVDGWLRIINSHKQLDGFEFIYSPSMVRYDVDLHPKLGGLTHPAHEWIECVITRKDRSKPIVVREYLDECYKKADPAGPWQSHTNRFLRHKALIQCARYAFGFAGIYDEDEAKRIIESSIDDDEAAAAVTKQVEMPEEVETFTAQPDKAAADPASFKTVMTGPIADPRIDKATTFDPPKTVSETETFTMKGTNEIVDVEVERNALQNGDVVGQKVSEDGKSVTYTHKRGDVVLATQTEPIDKAVDLGEGDPAFKALPVAREGETIDADGVITKNVADAKIAAAPVKTDDEPFPPPAPKPAAAPAAPAPAAGAATPDGDVLIAPSRRNLMLSRMTFHDVTEDAMKKKWGVVPAEVLHKQYVEIMNWIEQGGK